MASADIRISIGGGEVMNGGLMKFEPGTTMQCQVQLIPHDSIRCNRVIGRVMWHTEGRGSRAEGVALEVPIAPEGTLEAGQPIAKHFNVVLPKEPWSFAGHYINIVWELKITVDIPLASDINAAQVFVLAPRF